MVSTPGRKLIRWWRSTSDNPKCSASNSPYQRQGGMRIVDVANKQRKLRVAQSPKFKNRHEEWTVTYTRSKWGRDRKDQLIQLSLSHHQYCENMKDSRQLSKPLLVTCELAHEKTLWPGTVFAIHHASIMYRLSQCLISCHGISLESLQWSSTLMRVDTNRI